MNNYKDLPSMELSEPTLWQELYTHQSPRFRLLAPIWWIIGTGLLLLAFNLSLPDELGLSYAIAGLSFGAGLIFHVPYFFRFIHRHYTPVVLVFRYAFLLFMVSITTVIVLYIYFWQIRSFGLVAYVTFACLSFGIFEGFPCIRGMLLSSFPQMMVRKRED